MGIRNLDHGLSSTFGFLLIDVPHPLVYGNAISRPPLIIPAIR